MSCKIVFVGEAFGEQEELLGMPFVGAAGSELNRMLQDSGLLPSDQELTQANKGIIEVRNETYKITNVFNFRPANNDIKTLCVEAKSPDRASGLEPLTKGAYLHKQYIPELLRLESQIHQWNPNLICCLGATAAWAVLNSSGISKLRGATSISSRPPGVKVLATYHPAAVLRDYSLRPIVLADLAKAKLECEFSEIRRARRTLWLNPTLEDLDDFYHRYIDLRSGFELNRGLVCDIETHIINGTRQITNLGFAPSPNLAINIPFYDQRNFPVNSYWPSGDREKAVWKQVIRYLNCGRVIIGQNFIYDLTWLWGRYGIPIPNFDEDTMLLHHSLQPESEKGLDFLGSIYSNEMAWKLFNKSKKAKRDE